MSPVIARSAEIPRRPGPPRPPEIPSPPMPVPPPHLPTAPLPPLVAHVNVPQVPVLPPVWEYMQLTRTAAELVLDVNELNALGRDGWELVSVVTDGRGTHFYFKREQV